MPEMMVWPDSSSWWTRKVGSSFVKRLSAFEKLVSPSRFFGVTAREITEAGTCIEVQVTLVPSVKVSPEEHSMP
jgi:hypothetical protein